MSKLEPRWTRFETTAMVGALLAVVLTGAVAAPSSAATRSTPAGRALHLTKECSQYTGLADSFCTITSSDVAAITVGSRVVYLQAAGTASLDSDIVLVVGQGNYALGHVTLDFATGTGQVTVRGGTRQFTSFHARAAVSALGGPNWAWDGTYRLGGHED
jgi:hypothetical protein